MKKRILITYFKNGDMKNEVAKKLMHDAITRDFFLDGKEMVSESKTNDVTKTIFTDGSVIEVVPCGATLIGRRYTHIYTDATTISLGYDAMLKTLITQSKKYAFGKELNVYDVENGKLNIEKY